MRDFRSMGNGSRHPDTLFLPACHAHPFLFGRAKGSEINIGKDDAQFIDSLREAAQKYGAVADLLLAIRDGILIDDLGNKEVVADSTDLIILKTAQVAAAFSELDRDVM